MPRGRVTRQRAAIGNHDARVGRIARAAHWMDCWTHTLLPQRARPLRILVCGEPNRSTPTKAEFVVSSTVAHRESMLS